MITALPGAMVLATQAGLPTGLTGQLIVAVLTDVGAFVTSWTGAGITETPAGSGAYLAELEAPAVAGEYVVAWDQATVGLDPIRTEGLLVTAAPVVPAGTPEDAIPDLADVEALLRARTLAGGVELDVFTDDTRPTADQVQELIDAAVGDIAGRVAVPIAPELAGLARRLAAIRASLEVEQAYIPEQSGEDDTVHATLLAQFNTGIVELITTARIKAAAGTRLA